MIQMRHLYALIIATTVVTSARSQTYSLSENPHVGDCFRIQLTMSLDGEIRVSRDGKRLPLKLEASANHVFPERVLSVAPEHLPNKTARVYDTARATITLNKGSSDRTLRPDRRLIVAQRTDGRHLVYSPAGPLTRDELDLVSEHFDTLAIVGLLPTKPVAVGDSWKVPDLVTQALCGFEGLVQQNLECKLEEVSGKTAHMRLKGTSSGIDLGASVKLSIEANCFFDIDAGRIARVEWKQKDEREQGPVSPASSFETSIVLTRASVEQPATLSDVALVSVPDGFEPPEPSTQLEYRDARAGFELRYNRDWQMVSQTQEHLVMRLMDRGEFVSQVTLTPWTKAEKGKHMTPEDFRQAMEQTPGWVAEQELQSGEVSTGKDHYLYRVSGTGQLEGSKVVQNYYLAAGPAGDQIVLVFTMAPKQVDRLGTKDAVLAAGIEFVASKAQQSR
jgi:hypothetical protein